MLNKVKINVYSVTKDKYPQGSKVGDGWLIEDGKTPAGMFAGAYNSIATSARLCRANPLRACTMELNINQRTVDNIACSGLVLKMVTNISMGIFKPIDARKISS